MKKSILFGILLLAVAMLPLVSACAKSPTPTTPQTSAPTTTTPAKPTELIFFHLVPDGTPSAKIARAFGDKVTEQTKGRITFVYYWAGTLIPPGETLKSMQAGVADIAFFPPDANFQPLSYVLLLPFMGMPTMKAGSEIFGKLLEEFPQMAAEYEGLKIFAPRQTATTLIHTSKKVVKSPSDLNGVKVRVAMDKTIADFIAAAGGTPIEVPPPDLPMALEKGVVDGVYFSYTALNNFQLVPMMPYHTVFGATGISADLDTLAIRQQTWDKLPAAEQKIISDLAVWYQEQMILAEIEDEKASIANAQNLKHTITNLTPQEIKPWVDIGAPLHQVWIKNMEAKGKPGQKIYDRAKQLIAEYK